MIDLASNLPALPVSGAPALPVSAGGCGDFAPVFDGALADLTGTTAAKPDFPALPGARQKSAVCGKGAPGMPLVGEAEPPAIPLLAPEAKPPSDGDEAADTATSQPGDDLQTGAMLVWLPPNAVPPVCPIAPPIAAPIFPDAQEQVRPETRFALGAPLPGPAAASGVAAAGPAIVQIAREAPADLNDVAAPPPPRPVEPLLPADRSATAAAAILPAALAAVAVPAPLPPSRAARIATREPAGETVPTDALAPLPASSLAMPVQASAALREDRMLPARPLAFEVVTQPADAAQALTVPLRSVEQAGASAVPTTGIDLTHAAGFHRIIDHIEALRDAADARDTRIRLIPDALGPVDIAVRRDGDAVQVHFTASEAATRQLIADAQPRLAELAEARGVRIERATVDGGATGGQLPGQAQGQAQQQHTNHAAILRNRARIANDEPTTDERIA